MRELTANIIATEAVIPVNRLSLHVLYVLILERLDQDFFSGLTMFGGLGRMEEWRIVSKSKRMIYEVSDLGRVRSTVLSNLRMHYVKPRIHTQGYLRVTIEKKDHYIHRLVARMFLEQVPGYEVNHKNGDKKDNRVENLEWVSILSNIRHAITSGLMKDARWKQGLKVSGENNRNAKTTNEVVLEIRRLYSAGARPRDLAIQFSMSLSTLEKIIHRDTWKHI